MPWEHEAQFESDISNRGVFNQLEDGQAHNLEAAGSNPVPATLSKKNSTKGKKNNAIYCTDKRNESDKEKHPVLVLHSEKLDSF